MPDRAMSIEDRLRAHTAAGRRRKWVRLSVALVAVEKARLDERELLSARVYENGWCPTCAAPARPKHRELCMALAKAIELLDADTFDRGEIEPLRALLREPSA